MRRIEAIFLAVLIGVSGAYAQEKNDSFIVDPCLKDRKTCPQFRKPETTAPSVQTPPESTPTNPPPKPQTPLQPGRHKPDNDTRTITYGGPQTITCFQGGQLMFQHVGVYGVKAVWSANYLDVQFRIGGLKGERKALLVNLNGASCLIERTGKESTPIYDQYP